MTDSDDLGDVKSYILSSKYRSSVLDHLAGTGRATPKEIAESVDAPRSHISRALSELEEKSVVELRVPEGRTVGRYYGLTQKGEEAWPEIKRKIRAIEWDVEAPSTPAARSVTELAKEEFGESLRCVGAYDGERVAIYHIDPAVRADYSDEEFENSLRTLIFDHSIDELSMSGEDCWSDVLHFADFTVVRVRLPNESRVAISFDSARSVSVPEFAEAVASAFLQKE